MILVLCVLSFGHLSLLLIFKIMLTIWVNATTFKAVFGLREKIGKDNKMNICVSFIFYNLVE